MVSVSIAYFGTQIPDYDLSAPSCVSVWGIGFVAAFRLRLLLQKGLGLGSRVGLIHVPRAEFRWQIPEQLAEDGPPMPLTSLVGFVVVMVAF